VHVMPACVLGRSYASMIFTLICGGYIYYTQFAEAAAAELLDEEAQVEHDRLAREQEALVVSKIAQTLSTSTSTDIAGGAGGSNQAAVEQQTAVLHRSASPVSKHSTSSSTRGRSTPKRGKNPSSPVPATVAAAAEVPDSEMFGAENARVARYLTEMYRSLAALPWERVDIVGRPVLAHTDIVVRSTVWNAYGKLIIQHLVQHLQHDIK